MKKILLGLCLIASPLNALITQEQLQEIFKGEDVEAIDFFEGKYDEAILALMKKTHAFLDPYTFDHWQTILTALKDRESYIEKALAMIEGDDGTNDHIIEHIEKLVVGFYDIDG